MIPEGIRRDLRLLDWGSLSKAEVYDGSDGRKKHIAKWTLHGTLTELHFLHLDSVFEEVSQLFTGRGFRVIAS